MPQPRDSNQVPVPVERMGTNHALTVTAVASKTPVLNKNVVRLATLVDVYVAVGPMATVEATSASPVLPAGYVDYQAVAPGVDAVSMLRVTVDGVASVTEMD